MDLEAMELAPQLNELEAHQRSCPYMWKEGTPSRAIIGCWVFFAVLVKDRCRDLKPPARFGPFQFVFSLLYTFILYFFKLSLSLFSAPFLPPSLVTYPCDIPLVTYHVSSHCAFRG